MNYHPYSEIWPLMSGEDFNKFKADIVVNGQRMPVLTYQGQILDGRNRERACNEAGIQVCYETAKVCSDADALALVVSLNDHRRHMSQIERIAAAERLATIINGHNQHIKKILGTSNEVPSAKVKASHNGVSIEAAAQVMSVPPMSVTRMRGVKVHGGQAAVDEVLSGKVSLSKKYDEVTPKRAPKSTLAKRATAGRSRQDERAQRSSGGRVLRLHDAPPIPALTREQVDPEFKGTPMDWVDKYGHVQIMTAEQYATEAFDGWASNARALAKRWRELPDLGRAVDHNWLRSPKQYSVRTLSESLEFLRPKIAELEALLACAVAALEKKQTAASQQELRQPACG